jgi:hypothetical protein
MEDRPFDELGLRKSVGSVTAALELRAGVVISRLQGRDLRRLGCR